MFDFRRILASLFLLLFLPSLAGAEGLPLIDRFHQTWRWTRFGAEAGVPSGRVHRILETEEGQAWAHTSRGLAWFDEFEWHHITRRSPPLDAIEHGWMAKGRNGVLLTADGALYNVDTSGFHHVPVRWQGRPLRILRACLFGESGLLVQSDSALYVLRGDSLSLFPSPYEDPISAVLVNRPFGIWPADGGGVWLNAREGLFRFNENRWDLKVPSAGEFLYIFGLADDGQGSVVISLEEGSRAEFVTMHEGKTLTRNPALPGQFAAAISIAPGGTGLVANLGGDLYLHTVDGRILLDPLPPQMENTTSLFFRTNGDLWVGSDGVIHHCRLSSNLWSVVRNTVPGRSNNVNAILAASDGTVWIGTSNGLSILRPDGSTTWLERINGTQLGIVTGLAEDRDGGIWVSSGVSFSGAIRFFRGRWTTYGPGEGLGANIHRITHDRQQRLWFLGIGRGPVGLRPQQEPGAFMLDRGRFVHLGAGDGLRYGRVYDVAQRSDSSLWFATIGGLSVLHRGTWRYWTKESGLRDNKVFAVTVDNNDRVWIGHQWAVGLGCIEPTGEIRYVTTESGLVNDAVWGMLVDSTGRMWVSTRAGISSYSNGIWSSFTTMSGLPNSYTWPLASRQGSLYVGTMGGGMAVFRYGLDDYLPPLVHLNGPFERGGRTVIQWHVHAHWAQIRFDRVETRYMLDQGQWSPWGRTTLLELDHGDHGEHVLHVQAKGYLGTVAHQGTVLRFQVPPPAYLRPIVLGPILIVLVLGVSAFLFLWMEKRKHNTQLRESEERHRVVAEQTGQIVYDYDVRSGRIVWSGAIEEVTGYTPAEFTDVDIKRWEQMMHPDDRQRVLELLEYAQHTGELFRVEYRFRHRMGGFVYIADRGIFAKGPGGDRTRMLGSMSNISSQKVAEEQILASLHEKEILLKEIHHRVKNNMQIVSSLLNLQSLAIDDPRFRESFRESQNRIRSMALVHEKLYRSGSLARIDFGEYVRHLTAELVRSYNAQGITLTVRAEHVELGVDSAVPCGLVIHELVSNAVRHAFRGREHGTIVVSVEVLDGGAHVLSVSDDGVGFPSHIDFRSTESLGLQVVNTLVAQLGGTVDLTVGPGTTFTVTFAPART